MRENNRTLKKPKDITLPLFTYGIFKPGQIAYSKIKKYIINKNKITVNYPLKERDGVPILINPERRNIKTNGYILYFKENEKAYKIISETFSKELYKWDTIEENQKMNVLFGKSPKKGSSAPYSRDYDGKNDPLFKEAIRLINDNLKTDNFHNVTDFFKLQMNYMLLWSAIDRYCKLKYNKENEKENRIELSKEAVFNEALIKYAYKYHRPVFNTENLFENKFDINKPHYCINYYYTLRCNVVHRGKTSLMDIDMLKQATEELLNIFEYILNDTFNE